MNGRELLTAIYSGERFDRLPHPGIWPWGEAYQRWTTEGLPPGTDHNALLGFRFEDSIGLTLNLNMVPPFPLQVIEEGPDYVTLVDEFGVTKRLLRTDFDRSGGYKGAAAATSSMGHWLDFPVKDLRTWKVICEERFQPTLAGRVPENWEDYKREYKEKSQTRWTSFFCFPLCGLFGPMREMMGVEGLLFTFADGPALIHTIVNDLTDFWLAVFDQVLGELRLDQFMVFEDMCATKAPLIGPAMFREFLSPGYRKLFGGLREMGVREFWMDTDGNAWDILSEMIACGFTGTSPCEFQGNMYVARLREAFPTFNLTGGIAKHALTQYAAVIEAEVARCYRVAWEKAAMSLPSTTAPRRISPGRTRSTTPVRSYPGAPAQSNIQRRDAEAQRGIDQIPIPAFVLLWNFHPLTDQSVDGG